jgi:hypothetical protein
MMEEKEKTIHDLKLHEQLERRGGDICIMRVPGGWIYEYCFQPYGISCVFVPWSSEFSNRGGY